MSVSRASSSRSSSVRRAPRPPKATARAAATTARTASGPQRNQDRASLSRDRAAKPNATVPDFGSWASPKDTLKKGSSGTQVRQLQEQLNKNGFQLDVDGKFGDKTQAAVREWQKKSGVGVDGKVGRETLGSFSPAPETKAPEKAEAPAKPKDVEAPAKVEKSAQLPSLAGKDMTSQERYDHYASMVEQAGGKLDAKKPTVLGLRGLGPDGSRHDSGRNVGSNDETFVVLSRDKQGRPQVAELRGSTHAASRTGTRESQAKGGVAQLRPGNYDVNRRHDYKGHEAWAVNGGGNVPAYRDRNRDGQISQSEKDHAVRNKTQADGILFHLDRGTSIGCQTLKVPQLEKFRDAVGGGGFNYTLIDANQPL